MAPNLGHWFRVALATFISCIAVYEIFTDGQGEISTWFYAASAALLITAVSVGGVRIWRREQREEGER